MFGWVPSEGWVFLGLVFIIYFSKESIKLFLYKGKNKLYVIPFILFIISGIALVLLEGRYIFRIDIINLKYTNCIFGLYEISLILALISSFYLSYKEAKDNNDYNKINKIKKNMKPILCFVLILIFLRIVVMFSDNWCSCDILIIDIYLVCNLFYGWFNQPFFIKKKQAKGYWK